MTQRCVLLSALAANTALLAALLGTVNCAPNRSRGVKEVAAEPLSAVSLERRLSAFAADSMLGRRSGSPAHDRGVDYIAAELRRMRLDPAGENGTYFQTVPPVRYRVISRNSMLLDANGTALEYGIDYRPLLLGRARSYELDGARIVYGGGLGDTSRQLSSRETGDRVVVLTDAPNLPRRQLSRELSAALTRYVSARAVAVAVLERWVARPPAADQAIRLIAGDGSTSDSFPVGLVITHAAAIRLLGANPETLSMGTLHGAARGRVIVDDSIEAMGRNVLAVLRGRDPQLRHEYVALGAHSDGEGGIAPRPLDHDALRAASAPASGNSLARSARRSHPDSIYKAADDDGSGSIALVAIAEALARDAERPKRSILFVWHAAEEQGMLGSKHFVEHPTVPVASITAHLNLDMVGRGAAEDSPAGGPDYLLVLGARRRSSRLGELIDSVNAHQSSPLAVDTVDRDGSYAGSDHVSYACRGIPVALFTTGRHRDYHSVTDESRYIDYAKLSRVAQLVKQTAAALADSKQPLTLDSRARDAEAVCR